MKVLLVPFGLMRGISPPQNIDSGALTERHEKVGCTVKAAKGELQTSADPSRIIRAARLKRFGTQDDERRASRYELQRNRCMN